jgi:hypothetical protein
VETGIQLGASASRAQGDNPGGSVLIAVPSGLTLQLDQRMGEGQSKIIIIRKRGMAMSQMKLEDLEKYLYQQCIPENRPLLESFLQSEEYLSLITGASIPGKDAPLRWDSPNIFSEGGSVYPNNIYILGIFLKTLIPCILFPSPQIFIISMINLFIDGTDLQRRGKRIKNKSDWAVYIAIKNTGRKGITLHDLKHYLSDLRYRSRNHHKYFFVKEDIGVIVGRLQKLDLLEMKNDKVKLAREYR